MLSRKSFFVVLIFLLAAGYFWREIGNVLPCRSPLTYSIGSFDERFGISREVFLQELSLAEKVWEAFMGKELFLHQENALFTVNLIYDERQQRTQELDALSDSFDHTRSINENLTKEQDEIFVRYKREFENYERLLAEYKNDLDDYNKTVTKWNKKGGAPEDEYEKLEKERKKLERESLNIEERRKRVNALADQVNRFSREQVKVVQQYNEQVQDFENRYGNAPQEFDQGEYRGDTIDIYQFDDIPHLRLVLAHELGHALGIEHVENERSIMYHLMEKQSLNPLTLTSEDISMLRETCEKTPADFLIDQLRLLIMRAKEVWFQEV